MMKKQRCGTGDSGCCGPSMDHSSSNMCSGVFAPVCAPEVCNVPRIPHHQKLVEGVGCILDTESQQKTHFSILVEREMQVYKGVFKAQGTGECVLINAQVLKFFEGNGKTHMFAVFHEEATSRDIVVTVYKQHHEHQGCGGHQEPEGYQGCRGHQEPEGHQGHEGHQEPEGHQGHEGHQESEGHQGHEGHQEPEGHQGYEGYQEPEGHQGYEEYQGHPGHCKEETQVFIYSTSMEGTLINLGGELVAGAIHLYVDQNVHGH